MEFRMKRIAWLLLAVLCTMLVQVRALEPLKQRACGRCHCAQHGACGMPDCGQPVCAASQAPAASEPNRSLAAEERRDHVVSDAPSFFFTPACRAILPSRLPAGSDDGPAARLPLFRAHCSLLI